MEFSMNSKERAKANDLGAIVVLIGKIGQYMACFEKNIKVGLPKQMFIKESSQDFSYKNIRAVGRQDAGMISPGWLTLDSGGGIKEGISVDTPGTVIFNKKGDKLSREMQSFIEEKISEFSNDSQKVIQESSTADELKKFADLKEQGIITEEEFNTKKKELLGL